MAKDFPHLDDTGFPYPDTINPYKYENTFDYTQYDKTQMRVTVCSVPWDVGLIHVGNAQIGGLGNVVYFDGKDERDEWFDSIEDKHTWDTEYRAYHTDGYIKVPLPYEKCVLYNYVYVEYTKLPVDYADGGKDRFFFFIRACESLSPNTCKVEILRDTWQTYIYDIDISYMMLEQGHAPMSVTDADTYLANPIEHSQYLLADDVNFGGTYVSRRQGEIILNHGEMFAVVVSSADVTKGFGDFQEGTATTPDGQSMLAGQPNFFAYAMEPPSLLGFLQSVESSTPQFLQTIQAVFFIKRDLVHVARTVDLLDHPLKLLEQATSNISLVDLNKDVFGYGEDYKDLAKLYTYPYAYLEVSDERGSVNQVRIEETTGDISLTVTTSLAYPWLALDGRFSGIGTGGADVTFSNVNEHSFSFSGDWFNHLVRWEIPTFAVNVAASTINYYDEYYEREQKTLENAVALDNATLQAETRKTNADASADTALVNANRSAQTAKDNADASADTAFDNTTRSADATKDMDTASADTTFSNANRNAQASKDSADASVDTTLSNANRSALKDRTNTLASADTGYNNASRAATTKKQNADASATTARENAVASAGTTQTNANGSDSVQKQNADDSAETAYTNATNSIETKWTNADNVANNTLVNADASALADKQNSDRAAQAAYTNALAIAGTSKTNADANATTAKTNSYRAANAGKSQFEYQRTLAREHLKLLVEDGEAMPGYTGFMGAVAWEEITKLSDDELTDWGLSWEITGAENYHTAMSSVLNGVSGAASSVLSGAVGGMVAGPAGAGVGAGVGLAGSAITLATASASLPLTISTASEVAEASRDAAAAKTAHAENYIENVYHLQADLESNKYVKDQQYLTMIADSQELTAKGSADLLEQTGKQNATRNETTDKANALRTYQAATTNNQNTYDTATQNNANTWTVGTSNNLAVYNNDNLNAGNTRDTAKANALRSYTMDVANNKRRFNTDKGNAENTESTALANDLRSYTQELQNAQETKTTAYLNASRDYDTATQNASATHATGLDNNQRTYDTAVLNAEETYLTALENIQRTYDTAVDNADATHETALANNLRTYDTAVDNADATHETALANNLRDYDTAITVAEVDKAVADEAIENRIRQAGLDAPTQFGTFANGETSTTRPMGVFCNVVTQTQDAIEQAGDHFLRFGYRVNRNWRFTTFNLMPHYTYWKCADMWIKGNNVPDAYLDEIRFFLLGGVCVWRDPADIGIISIYDN